jgi:hypothetical protein
MNRRMSNIRVRSLENLFNIHAITVRGSHVSKQCDYDVVNWTSVDP